MSAPERIAACPLAEATSPLQAVERLAEDGCALLSPEGLRAVAGVDAAALEALAPHWEALPPDAFLRDGGRYRQRRHDSCVVELPTGRLVPQPRRAHWQPVEYNALHGGLERWFEPIEPQVAQAPPWRALVAGLARCFAQAAAAAGRPPVDRWFVEAHQFRIHTAEGIGRPTPEGAHRDGVDFVAVILVDRRGVKGGETRVFEADGPRGLRFTMSAPWSALLLDDARVIHETTPIQPAGDAVGRRDTLVLTYRQGGFQGPGQR